MVAKFLDQKKRELKQRRRGRQRLRKEKSNRFTLTKQQLCTCIALFWTFLSLRCTAASGNFLTACARLMESVNKFSFFFFLYTVLLHWIPDNSPIFDKFNETSVVTSMKFVTVRINFLSDVFRFLVIQKFCYHGNVMWRRLLSVAPSDCFVDAVASFIGYYQIVRENGLNIFP